MKKFYLSSDEVKIIASTPKRECWICNDLINNINKDENGYFLKEKNIIDDGIEEHLKQILNKEIIFI